MTRRQNSTAGRRSDRPIGETQVKYLPVSAIFPDPNNPRIHDHQQVRAIARSIEAFGFNAPILVRGDNQIVAGHGRLEAAKLLNLTEVPVIRLEHLTDTQARQQAVGPVALG